MGNVSSRSTATKTTPNGETIGGGMARGKTVEKKIIVEEMMMKGTEESANEEWDSFPTDEEETEESDLSDDEEEEEEEEDEEMMRILADARMLKRTAEAFLYPERPVVADATACARNYFNRASAEVPEAPEDAEERARIMEDAMALKKLAVDYAHPELPVVTTDETACGRSYFDRASAIEQESVEEAEERARILADAVAIKKLAVDYLHPEMAVVTTDETACARSYFDRASAPEETEERDLILQDAMALKKLAVDYAHPELAVVTTDETACGRNYFDRASAPIVESVDLAEERDELMQELQLLKKLAIDYAHPELAVFTTDDTACGRLYFNRASAVEQEDEEEAEERDLIMQDMLALKQLATEYLHPELPVVTTDETACARNYFGRASATEMETMEEAEERARVMEDTLAFKKWAVDFAHPELPVVTSDPTSSGRNYFGRASASEQETMEEAEERLRIMEETKALKMLAVDYAHPELPVAATEATLFGRSYFGRFSAPEQMSAEEAEEYELFMLDAMHLKAFAMDYLHPELAVISDETAGARNYFERASAVEMESAEEAEERALILQEMQAMKKLAVDYAHPEIPVVTTDATACGRNYYVRASAKGNNFITTTRTVEEPTTYIEHEIEDDHYLDECDDFHFGNFELDEEEVCDLKYEVHKLLDPLHYSSFSSVDPEKVQGDITEEEAGKLSRSPSSVMLFGGYEQAA